MLNTVLDGDNHVAESFNGSAICYSSSCRNNLDRAASPRFEGFQKAVKCAALRLVNLRIAASRKYLVPIDCGAYVEMHKAVRTTVSRLLMHEVDGFPIEIEGQDFRERHPGMLDPNAANRAGGGGGAPMASPPSRWSAFSCMTTNAPRRCQPASPSE